MASIVAAVGSSHGPSIQTQPEEWGRLGDGDTRDPRFNYEALLKKAKAGLEAEISLGKQRERYTAAHAALGTLTEHLTLAKPDVVVVISNTHRIRPGDSQPVFSVFRGASLPVAKRDGAFDPDARFRTPKERAKQTLVQRPAEPALGEHLINALVSAEFDVACVAQYPEGSALDDAFSFPYEYLLSGKEVPLLPLQLSRYLPYQATPGRCYALGIALRKAIESWPTETRVAIIASGGLSHQVIDEELDHQVIEALESGNREVLASLSRERLNAAPGTPEILNWVTVAGVMEPGTMRLVDYLPCYRSLAGTGHGLTFGYWTA